jgi:agmatinase
MSNNIPGIIINDPDGAKVVLLGLPYEKTVSNVAGTALGPKAICFQMKDQLEDRDCRLDRSLGSGVCIAECHLGHITELEPRDMCLETARVAVEILRQGKYLVGLGGEHTVTLGLVQSHKEIFGDFAVVQLDAHLDLRDETEYKTERLKIAHSTVMRRVHELGILTYHLAIRSESLEEHQFILGNGLQDNILYAHSYAGSCGIIDRIKEKNVYLTIDVDGFDPSVMPATGTPEPGGWGWQTFLHFAGNLFRRKNIVGFDVVEVSQGENFSRAESDRTAYNAAKLIYHLLCLKFLK